MSLRVAQSLEREVLQVGVGHDQQPLLAHQEVLQRAQQRPTHLDGRPGLAPIVARDEAAQLGGLGHLAQGRVAHPFRVDGKDVPAIGQPGVLQEGRALRQALPDARHRGPGQLLESALRAPELYLQLVQTLA